jgi:triosephosphate isomerase (TIM)
MRPHVVAGNWKMNTTRDSARKLAQAVVAGAPKGPGVLTVLCPPFVYLRDVAEIVAGSPVALGGQNCNAQPKGAYTGEISAAMLVDVGCTHVILGHSERRHGLGESDGTINDKVHAALAAGLNVILCVGETKEERKDNRMERVFSRQVAGCLAKVDAAHFARLIIAYEPVWAIGTGDVATPEQAQDAHAFIRSHIATSFGPALAERLPILYGGSVTAATAAGLFSRPDIDGGLIGGASLKADEFLAITRAAVPA